MRGLRATGEYLNVGDALLAAATPHARTSQVQAGPQAGNAQRPAPAPGRNPAANATANAARAHPPDAAKASGAPNGKRGKNAKPKGGKHAKGGKGAGGKKAKASGNEARGEAAAGPRGPTQSKHPVVGRKHSLPDFEESVGGGGPGYVMASATLLVEQPSVKLAGNGDIEGFSI